jgi:hypothetical protein
MHLRTSALWAMVAVGLLAGCSANGLAGTSVPSSVGSAQVRGLANPLAPQWSDVASLIPQGLRPAGETPLHGRAAPQGFGAVAGGLYVGEFYSTDLYGYARGNASNEPPSCTYPGVLFPNDVASDDHGDVIDPDGGSRSIMIFKGSGKCGKLLGMFRDKYGQPVDATSADALNGTIAVANIYSAKGFGHKGGTITLCTLQGGCTTNLVNPNMYEVAGVAMSRSGDCWATAVNASGAATLTYFQGCSGAGETASGFANQNPGGIDIDKQGHLLILSSLDGHAYVYSGCNPACKLIGHPYALKGQAMYGHFNRQAMAYAAADYQYGQIDIYRYNNGKLSYMYSFNNGLTSADLVEGVAFAPRSHQ